MSLSSLQLDAFFAVARSRSFSSAAKALHISQSALSQRVINLEDEIGATLLVRSGSGATLTETGDRLLRYCSAKEALEKEALGDLKSKDGEVLKEEKAGQIRIGGFSSVTQSIVLPALSDLVRLHPKIHIEILNREMRELPALLRNSEIDYAIVDQPIERSGVKNVFLGYEENVLVGPTIKNKRANVFLDHDSEDQTTARYFKGGRHKSRARLTRSFLDDIYGILAGVKLGYGNAIVPRHLLYGLKGIKILDQENPLLVPVYLNYYELPFYTRLHEATLPLLKDAFKMRLASK